LSVHGSELGDSRINISQFHAFDALFNSSAAIQSAKSILLAQLLSGGIVLQRNGETLKAVKFGETGVDGNRARGVTKTFSRHLNEHWLPFARDVIESFLKWGICAVTFSTVQDESELVSSIDALKARLKITGSRKRKAPAPVLIPVVPHAGTYEIGWLATNSGYTRDYKVYCSAPGRLSEADLAAFVAIRGHPDASGNLCSPIATVFRHGSFTQSLVELAFTAEISRATPSMVTQVRQPPKTNDLSAGSLFIDSESRAQQDQVQTQESLDEARALELQSSVCRMINSLQTRVTGESSAASTFVPPEVPPKLFVIPKGQEVAPHLTAPQPRGDLEALIRLNIDEFCAALGVPSSLVFEGAY
jgi:hypothetical protein